MEKTVIFRDYQEQQSADHNNIQVYARASFDDLVNDAVTATLRYSGFAVTRSNQAEITIGPGRFYGKNVNGQVGAVYSLPVQTVESMVQYLAAASQRIVTVVAYGNEDQVDVQTRDFLTNVTTGQTEPQAIAMTDSRDAVLAIVQGAEGADPQPPAIATTQVAIANVLLDKNGVVSITQLTAGLVSSTEGLNNRLISVEEFDAQIAPRVAALAADLAALANKLNKTGQQGDIIAIYQDLAKVKEKVGLPESYSQYGADYFMWPDPSQSDLNNSQALGFNALVEEGCRFPSQNASTFALSLFNTLDPNAAYSNGLLLPAYDSVLKLETGAYNSSLTIGQYGFQTYNLVQKEIAYSRIRDGGSYTVCSNGVTSFTPGDTTVAWWLPNFSTYETSETTVVENLPGHYVTKTQYFWHDSWNEPYWELDTINHTINGAQVAQTFLASSDMWVTKLGIYLTSVASATDVWLSLTKVVNGVPDLKQVVAHVNIPGASLVQGWNEIAVVPAFLSKGDRMGVVVTSAANHGLGMAAGGSYLDGTFMYSTDGAYFLGDLTKEMMLRVYSAQFRSSQVTIEFGAINLQGGIRDIDLTARMILPPSCQLVFEVLPDGTGTWLPITEDSPLVPFANAPVLCRFRGRFIGTPAIAPGIVLPDSICKIWCPGPTFRHISEVETLSASTMNLSVQAVVENFNPVAHTLAISIDGPVAAKGSITFTLNPANGTTITLGGTAVTFVNSGATGNQVNIGASLAATLTALQTLLASSADVNIVKCGYTTTSTVLNVTYKGRGTAGNSFTLATTVTGATVSGATLSGGAAVGNIAATSTTTTLVDASKGQYKITANFVPTVNPISTFSIQIDGTTNSVANTFHVAQRLFWAL
jgi:hypothetical protein